MGRGELRKIDVAIVVNQRKTKILSGVNVAPRQHMWRLSLNFRRKGIESKLFCSKPYYFLVIK